MYQQNIAAAQAQEFAITRALSGAFGGGDNLPEWPDWESPSDIEDRLNPTMLKLRAEAMRENIE